MAYRTRFGLGLLALTFATQVHAGALELSWQPTPGATGYRVYTSETNGRTWVQHGTDLLEPKVTVTNLPDDKLVLVRVSAHNAGGEEIRKTSGFWYDGTQTLSINNLGLK